MPIFPFLFCTCSVLLFKEHFTIIKNNSLHLKHNVIYTRSIGNFPPPHRFIERKCWEEKSKKKNFPRITFEHHPCELVITTWIFVCWDPNVTQLTIVLSSSINHINDTHIRWCLATRIMAPEKKTWWKFDVRNCAGFLVALLSKKLPNSCD